MEKSYKKRTLNQSLLLSVKGLCMGAADVVPGVSGGTIAFITGIYEELIASINAININSLKIWKNQGFKAFWNAINGSFFVFLFIGIAISIIGLAKVVTYTLSEYPVLIWSFFFGLILASIWLVARSIEKWNAKVVLSLLIGTAFAFWISTLQTTGKFDGNLYIFISGFIAICAMILPGISGSFILVLLGSYQIVLNAIIESNFQLISVFALGCIIGLLSFAKLLKYLFENFKNITIAALTGFLIGSLYKIWPWKNNVGDQPIIIKTDGEEIFMTENVLPHNYIGEPSLWFAILLAFFGFFLIFILDKFAPKQK